MTGIERVQVGHGPVVRIGLLKVLDPLLRLSLWTNLQRRQAVWVVCSLALKPASLPIMRAAVRVFSNGSPINFRSMVGA